MSHDLDDGVGPRGGRSTYSQYGLRMSLWIVPSHHARLAALAKSQGRSLNSVIADLLARHADADISLQRYPGLSTYGRRITLYLDPDLVQTLRVRSVTENLSVSSLLSSIFAAVL